MSAVPTSPPFSGLDEPLPPRPSFGHLRRAQTSIVADDAAWAKFFDREPAVAPGRRRRLLVSLTVAAALVFAVALGFLTLSHPQELRFGSHAAAPSLPAAIPTTSVAGASSGASATAATGTSAHRPLVMPVPAALKTGAAAPGALPNDFDYRYSSSWRGWPVEPTNQEHPVRGSFLAPRTLDSSYHFGVDISVDDDHPDPGVPAQLRGLATHRVIAVDDGIVSVSPDGSGYSAATCMDQHFAVASTESEFDYWHIYPTVPLGAHVHAGETIGWTCKGAWHLHLSELQYVNGVLSYVNPLHAGGKLTPYTDTDAPVVGKPRFYSPASSAWCPQKSLGEKDDAKGQSQWNLKGLVEVRAAADAPQSYAGFLSRDPLFADGFTPYRVSLVWWKGKRPVLTVNSFRGDSIPTTPYLVHFAPGSAAPKKLQECVDGADRDLWCGGSFVYRPLSTYQERYLDTRSLKDGAYVVTVYAWNERGVVGQHSVRVYVDNGAASRPTAHPLLVTDTSTVCPLSSPAYRVSVSTDS